MRELRDLYDINSNKTNKKYYKGDTIPKGYYPMVVMVAIRNSNGEFLMQKRVESKGGDWGVTGGHPKAGETPLEGIITEVKEELGLDFSNENFIEYDSGCDGKDCYKMYFVTKNIEIENIKIQEDELTEVKWFSMDELNYMVETNELNEDQIACFRKVCLYINREIIEKAKNEIVLRSNEFEKETKGTKDEYNLWREHVQYVYKYALLIAKNKSVDMDVVELSALLHDIAMTDLKLERAKHNEYGSEIAGILLKKFGLSDDKIELVKKCILNHSSKRKEYRTTEEENILVNADAMAHFDCIESIYSLAYNVMGLNEEDSVQFVKDKLTKDYLEIDGEIKSIIDKKYNKIMKSNTLTDMLN